MCKYKLIISAIAIWLLVSTSAYSSNFSSPSLTISGNSNVVKLQNLKIDVKIIGSMATTTCDMTFVNTSGTLLEGELNFPLMQGQNISEFWMELNGKLRKAVPVEKAKGRAVYEEIVRRNVDPALLEKTEGNNFRMRVYPINPNSTKRIVISYQEILSENESGKRYFLPLYYNSEIKNFSMDLAVFDENVVNPKTNSELSDLNSNKDSNGYYIKVTKKDYSLNTGFEFLFANSSSEKLVYSEKYNNKTYFMANVRLFSEPNSRPIPKNISIYYDISHSGYLKNLEKESAMWKAYLSSFDNVNVNLYTFNLIEQKKYSFACGAEKNDKFIDFIENIKYDGASSYNQLNYQNDNADLIIVFTDGMINYLSKDFPKSPKPLIILNANQFADELSLKKIARQNDGVYINLLSNELDDALESMKDEANILQRINILSGSVSEIYPADKSEFKHDVLINGILTSDNAKIELLYSNNTNEQRRDTIEINQAKEINANGMIARQWAQQKIDFLTNNSEISNLNNNKKEEIQKIGQEFSIVTDNTSLIVLETLSDYLKYEITPPEEFLAEYNAKIKEEKERKKRKEEEDISKQLSKKLNSINDLEKWKTKIPKEFSISKDNINSHSNQSNHSEPDALYPGNSTRSQSNRTTIAAFRVESAISSTGVTSSSGQGIEFRGSSAETTQIRLEANNITNRTRNYPDTISRNPYLKFIDKVRNLEFEKIDSVINSWHNNHEEKSLYLNYLIQKDSFKISAYYYFKVAELALKYNFTDIANLILSNIAELQVSNHEYLRVLAHKLEEIKEYEKAEFLYKKLIQIRSEEPQSYRDLALLNAKMAKYQLAADQLYEIAQKKWDSRFPEIELIVLNELNNLIALHPKEIDTSKYDSKFLYKMECDLRIVIDWDVDNTDVDLWLTNPQKEKCYYSNRLPISGGRLSKDFTGGYGPEEYLLVKAEKGFYLAEAKYLGQSRRNNLGFPIVKATIFRNWGRTNQSVEEKSIILDQNNKAYKIDNIEFK